VEGVAFSPDDRLALRLALSGSADGSLIPWDLETGDIIRRFTGHSAGVHNVAFLPDGKYALSASADGTLILWDMSSGEIVKRLTGHTDEVWDVAAHPDGQRAISASADGTLCRWDLATGQTLRVFTGHEGAVLSLDISADGKQAISGSADHSVILWDIETDDGDRYVVHHMRGHDTYIREGVVQIPEITGHQGPVYDVTFIPFSQAAMSVSEDRFAILWDLETGAFVREYQMPRMDLYSIASMPNGRLDVLGTLNGRVLLLTRYDGATELEFLGHEGRVLVDIAPQAVRSVAFSPTAHRLLLGLAKGASAMPDYRLRLVDTETGADITPPDAFAGHTEAVQDVAWHPEGHTALSSGLDGQIILWDIERGHEIQRFVGHTGTVYRVIFSPGCDPAADDPLGCKVLSGGADNTIILWDIESGQILRRYRGHSSSVFGLAFTPGSRTILSTAAEDTVCEWRVDLDNDALTAWAKVNRYVPDLTDQQRTQYHMEIPKE